MKPFNQFKSYCFKATETPDDIKNQFGKMRYKMLDKNDDFAIFNHANRTEFDEYDGKSTTVYVIATSEPCGENYREVLAATRVMPTVVDHEYLGRQWAGYLDQEKLLSGLDIYVNSRWVCKDNRTYEGKIGNGLVSMRLHLLAEQMGFNRTLGITTPRVLAWMRRRDIRMEEMTAPCAIGGDGRELFQLISYIDKKFYFQGREAYTKGLKQMASEAPEIASSSAAGV